MNNRRLCGLVVTVFLFTILIAGCIDEPVAQTEKKTYIIGFDGAYPPFAYTDELGNDLGFDVESAKWIAEQKGFEVTYQTFAWIELIPALQNGRIDMIYTGMTITPDRSEIIDFTNPYWTVNQAVASRKDSDITMEDFYSGKAVIAVERASSACEWIADNFDDFEKRVDDGTIILYDSFAMSVMGVQGKETDVVVFDEVSLERIIIDRPLKIIGIIETDEEYGVAVQKGDAELLKIMNEGLEELKASPKWQELIDKYILNSDV